MDEEILNIRDFDIDYKNNIENRLRLGFIRKVYSLLLIQLSITTIGVGLSFIEEIKLFLLSNIILFYIAFIFSIGSLLSMLCFPILFRKIPINYILLILWTICEAYMISTISSVYPPDIVLTAISLTCLVTLVLTIYAWTTKTDFTAHIILIYCFGFILFYLIIFSLLFGLMLYPFICAIGVVVYSVYLILDTQLILGKFKNGYDIDDYILATMNIYLDVIQLFLFLLDILNNKR